MSALIDAVGWTLLHSLWQAALIGLAAAAAPISATCHTACSRVQPKASTAAFIARPLP